MKIDIDSNTNHKNCVSAYSSGQITVNDIAYTNSFVLMPDTILPDWQHKDVNSLGIDDFNVILELKPEIILLGTGSKLCFPDPALITDIQTLNIGFEVMDTMAACRSYNILLAEERQIAAALILEKHSN